MAEWSRFSVDERVELAKKTCGNEEEAKQYNDYLAGLIKKYTGKEATALAARPATTGEAIEVPDRLREKLKGLDWYISAEQWNGLTDLQRFALLKLCRPGHESRNFPKAMKEFGLLSTKQIPL